MWSFFVPSSGQTTAAPANPKRPAQGIPRRVRPVGTQDSPVLPGQKPDQIPAPVTAQPKRRRPVPWWEADWARTRKVAVQVRQKREALQEDVGPEGPAGTVEGMGYSDVIGVDFSQPSIQGRMHRVALSSREGAPLLREYVRESNADFVTPPLPDVAQSVDPVVMRNPGDGTQVSPQFAAWGAPTIERTNVYSIVR